MPNPKMLKRERERLLQERAQARQDKRKARKAERAAGENAEAPHVPGDDVTAEEVEGRVPQGD